jgi:galactose mutarotase-like enzyme
VFNSAEYLTASKTVPCKQHCRIEPRNLSVLLFSIQITSGNIKITADPVVCHFPLLYRWLKEETRVIRNYIRDVINYLKMGFSLERGICLEPWYLPQAIRNSQGQIPLRWGKAEKLSIG